MSSGTHRQQASCRHLFEQFEVGHFLFAVFSLSGLVVILYAPVLRSMAGQWWDDPNYGHALFVPGFVAYVLWRERARWRTEPVRANDYGLPIMLSAPWVAAQPLESLSAELLSTARVSLIILISGIIVFPRGVAIFSSVDCFSDRLPAFHDSAASTYLLPADVSPAVMGFATWCVRLSHAWCAHRAARKFAHSPQRHS